MQESCEIFLILILYSKQELERYFGAKQVLYIIMLSPQLSQPDVFLQQDPFLTIVLLFTYSYSKKKRYTIAPKKETPTLDPSLNKQLSILCIYGSQWTSSTRFIIEEFIGILPQHSSKKEFRKRKSELSYTLQALYHSCRVLSPLHLGPGFQSRYKESRKV